MQWVLFVVSNVVKIFGEIENERFEHEHPNVVILPQFDRGRFIQMEYFYRRVFNLCDNERHDHPNVVFLPQFDCGWYMHMEYFYRRVLALYDNERHDHPNMVILPQFDRGWFIHMEYFYRRVLALCDNERHDHPNVVILPQFNRGWFIHTEYFYRRVLTLCYFLYWIKTTRVYTIQQWCNSNMEPYLCRFVTLCSLCSLRYRAACIDFFELHFQSKLARSIAPVICILPLLILL